ncbi:MAG: hypothetical protein L0Y76_06070 [Ignavibacteria bacterium]|nr:hypothetical protein [Ignavibacteria bacterium]
MKKIIYTLLLILSASPLLFAQDINTDNNLQTGGVYKLTDAAAKKFSDNLFYGGEFGAMFGDYTAVSITPQIGYKISNYFSTILKIGYAYASNKDYKDVSGSTLYYNQYGGSVVVRYAPIRQFYLMLEPAYYSYELPVQRLSTVNTYYYDKEREAVPFVYLGAGTYQGISNSSFGITAEIKVDLLRDSNSPYEEWNPIITVGGVYGF